ncbi:MAG: hypothetical protein LBJ91_02015 [Clostridiales Family XIII bacterium]|nr:hypothetical protein [Clostridiales Family XIII bacterium]
MKSSKNHRAVIEKIVEDTVVSVLVDQILRRVALHNRKAIVVFTEALLGFDAALDSLRELKKNGLAMTGVIAQSKDEALDRPAIKEALGVASLCGEMGHIEALELAGESDFVIVPTLSISSAAKLAHGITDSVATGVIQAALFKGAVVIASRDASCPNNRQRADMGFSANGAYRFMMSENLGKLSDFGVRLTSSDGLADAVIAEGLCLARIERRTSADRAPGEDRVPGAGATTRPYRAASGNRSRILALSDVNTLARGSGLRIGKDVRVTALAAERIREMRIKLIRE